MNPDSCVSDAKEEIQVPQISIQKERLEKQIALLLENIDRLDGKLASVVQVVPSENVAKCVEQETLVPLASFLRDQKRHVEAANHRLDTLLRQIEL